jgi:hypothetical protein
MLDRLSFGMAAIVDSFALLGIPKVASRQLQDPPSRGARLLVRDVPHSPIDPPAPSEGQ